MRSGLLTPSRPRRRALGLLLAGLVVAGAAVTGCSDNEPADPAISGENPAEVTVPTVPPSTTEATDDLGQGQGDAEAPDTGGQGGQGGGAGVEDVEGSDAPTTVPPEG